MSQVVCPTKLLTLFLVEHSEKSALYYSYIPVVPDRSHYRKFDTVALKDIRRRLDGGYCAPEEVDQIAQDLMDDCVVVRACHRGERLAEKRIDDIP